MKSMTRFQLILTLVFGLFVFIGVAIFATYQGGANKEKVLLTIWGTLPEQMFMNITNLDAFRTSQYDLRYVQKDPTTFDRDFVNALASGTGPDLAIIPHDTLLRHEDKVILVPYSALEERQFKDTFIEESEMLLRQDGFLGMPFIIDPLLMYWNRSMYQSAGLVRPPQKWAEFVVEAPRFNQKDSSGNLKRTLVAMGGYSNIRNAKDILAAIMLQSGTSIVVKDNYTNKYVPVLDQGYGQTTPPAESALRFFTDFADPAKPTYSWNRSLPDSERAFVEGLSATYFGFASEYGNIRNRNPNLNFDIAMLPQTLDGNIQTFGRLGVLVIPRQAKNPNASFGAAVVLTSPDVLKVVSSSLGLPPVRRDMLSVVPNNDSLAPLFFRAALVSRGWLDPNPESTGQMFKQMIEGVTSGRLSTDQAVNQAQSMLSTMLSR